MTKPQRYGASAMPCDSGIFVMHSEYEKVVAERDALREDAERYQWLRDKANSMGHVERAPMALMTRDDCSNDGWRDVLQGADLDNAIDAARGAK